MVWFSISVLRGDSVTYRFGFDYRVQTPFTNPARSDDLILRHWRPKPALEVPDSFEERPEEDEDKKEDEEPKPKVQDVSGFSKFNIKAQCPKRYTEQQYDKLLQSEDWSREETEYLMDLSQEYDLRWVVIADRYDYRPGAPSTDGESTALVPATGRHRTMEDMKSRYYTVAANMLAVEHPPSEMSGTEFELYDKMLKFNPEREKSRKDLATAQLNRNREEVAEERLLLEELKRIVADERNFMEERKELYARLETPASNGNAEMYQSSQGLSQLLQSLLQADKNKKRRTLLGPETGISSPSSQSGAQATPAGARDSGQETPAAPAPAPSNKKGAAAAGASGAGQLPVKTLTPSDEAKYGVTHHDRLTSGVQFRNDRAQKLTQAKSNVQSQKLAAALTELGTPPRLFMPTEKVCKEFEKLVHSVNLLLDTRKVADKVESEIRVLEAAKQEREQKEKEKEKAEGEGEGEEEGEGEGEGQAAAAEEGGPVPQEAPAVSPEGQDAAGAENDTDEKDDIKVDEDPAAPAETTGTTEPVDATSGSPTKGSHKRSASELSAVSDRSTKKQKK